MHGAAAGQVRRKALQRVALHDALASADRRAPAEVLLDAVHVSDVLLQRAQVAAVEADEPVPADILDDLVAAVSRAASLARITHDAGLNAGTLASGMADRVIEVLSVAGTALGMDLDKGRASIAVASAIRVLQASPGLSRREAVARVEAVLAEHYPERPAVAPAAGPEPADEPVVVGPLLGPERASGAAARSVPADGVVDAVLVEPAGEPVVEVPVRRPVRAVARVAREVGSLGTCPGCGRPRDREHDATCGYALAVADGRGGVW